MSDCKLLAVSHFVCPVGCFRLYMPLPIFYYVAVYCVFAFSIVIAVCRVVDCFTVSHSCRIWMVYLCLSPLLELCKKVKILKKC